MIIPHRDLQPATLTNLIEEFVSREGTDNGFDDTLEQRVQAVHRLLESGEAVILYTQLTESVNIIMRHDLPEEAELDAMNQVQD
ncbi:YheU family protein [Aestuariirhabdus sp. Z084]|uniref:YheU family protein n=1 Tax=Aestuariirhabdus haliotis TaxID=2918751 RepID=UPI00201B45F3|nr:YheU family protein [Aestuariirhabdus haliotis]MCL6415554.1 YheU family protein [Aestuariirhabdus haliotis]MCL6419241.1 YheU family protein [Aestuariirhabdus haliotis]